MAEYVVVKKLGQGSFGEAILVRRQSDSKLVVCKKMRVHGMSAEDKVSLRVSFPLMSPAPSRVC